jgi:hypothetical protein
MEETNVTWKDRILIYGTVSALYAFAAWGAVCLLQKARIIEIVSLFTDQPDVVMGPNIVPAAGIAVLFGSVFGTALALPNRMRWLNDGFR